MANSDTLYDRILSNGPSPGTLFILLTEMKKQGQAKEVMQECIRALKLYPEDLHIRALLAETYFEDGRIAQAEEEMNRVISLIEDVICAYKIQAKIFSRQKRQKEAIQALKRYLTHQPEDQEANDLFNDLKSSEEVPVSEPEPDISPDISMDEALVPAEARPLVSPIPEEEEPPHIDLIEPTEAEEAALPPDFPEEEAPQMDEKTGIPEIVTPTLAEIYYSQGQLEKAIEIYERVMDTDPEDEKSRHRLTALRAELRPIPTDEKLEAEKGIMEKNKKLIAILESWLDNIRQMTDSSDPGERL